jgi:hypothetical protein
MWDDFPRARTGAGAAGVKMNVEKFSAAGRERAIDGERATSGPPDRLAHADVLLRASRRVLRPLIKAMIAHGITLPAVVALLKQVYVEVAADSFALGGKPPTDSRVSMLTGVHRKDVRTLRQRGVPATAPPAMSVSATVVGRWLGDPRFAGADGKARTLPRSGGADGPSFSALVAEVDADVRARTVLDELLRQGLVAHDEAADEVILLVDAFVPRNDSPEIFDFFASNLHDHGAAATENLLATPGKPPFLERAVYYDGLSPASVETLDRSARRLALHALGELNAEALALQRADEAAVDATERFRFGVYFYRARQDRAFGAATEPEAASRPTERQGP